MTSEEISTSCHCKAIILKLKHKPTEPLNECHCSICRRYSAQWAYYNPKDVEMVSEPDASETYIWGDKQLEFHRCRKCGCVTHWASIDKSHTEMGVNGRLFEKDVLKELPVKHDGLDQVDYEGLDYMKKE